jgi:hypothetical protein
MCVIVWTFFIRLLLLYKNKYNAVAPHAVHTVRYRIDKENTMPIAIALDSILEKKNPSVKLYRYNQDTYIRCGTIKQIMARYGLKNENYYIVIITKYTIKLGVCSSRNISTCT